MPPDLDTTTETEVKPEDTSIRAGLEAAFDEATPPETPAVKPTPSPAPAAAAAPAAEVPAPAGEVPPEASEPETPAAPTERPIPERLKTRYGEKWATLPPDIRETFHEYESNIGRLASTYGKGAKNWEQTQRVFAPYADMVAQEGGDIHTAMGSLLETARILRQGTPEQKVVLLRQTAQMFGVPLELIGGGQPPEGGAAMPSEALINRLNTLEREVLTTRATAVHDGRQQVGTEVEAFVNDSANVYLQEPGYMQTMAALIGAGKAVDLPDAYKQAAWLHDRTRQLEIAKTNQQRVAEQRQRAELAKRASSSVNGNAIGSVRTDPSKLSLRDTLAAAFDGELDS